MAEDLSIDMNDRMTLVPRKPTLTVFWLQWRLRVDQSRPHQAQVGHNLPFTEQGKLPLERLQYNTLIPSVRAVPWSAPHRVAVRSTIPHPDENALPTPAVPGLARYDRLRLEALPDRLGR